MQEEEEEEEEECAKRIQTLHTHTQHSRRTLWACLRRYSACLLYW